MAEMAEMAENRENSRPLAPFRPFLVAANVRGEIHASAYCVASGVGRIGDLVLGSVVPPAGRSITVLDSDRNAHSVSGPQRVVAVLGPRDSSTHVCARIPDGGLEVREGTEVHWVAGESGIVGCLEREPPTNSIHAVETAARFVCDGLIFDAGNRAVNIRQFTVAPPPRVVETPILLVAATSSESGKTVLSGEIIQRLADAGLRIGALKVTGTGGVLDSLHHRRSGAMAVLDFVDAGMITSYVDSEAFRRRIPLIFRQVQSSGIDLIVAELGGDLLAGNNPAVFRIGELMDRAIMLIVISNDALAALGVEALNDSRLGFPAGAIRHFTSPFRNHAGMARRMELAGIPDCFDPRSPGDLARVTDEIIDRVAAATKPEETHT